MEDREIVELYWNREETAIKETEKKYERYLMTIAYQILENMEDCKESVNDTYLSAWNSIPPHKPENLATYLGKLTRRISIDIYRKKNRKKRKDSEYALSLSELEDCISDEQTPEHMIDEKMLAKMINEFVRTLPKETRIVFIGRYYYLDSVKKIANYCNMSEAKVKTLLYRTRCSLKEYLEKEGFWV